MNAPKFPLSRGLYEGSEAHDGREVAVGAALYVAFWVGMLACTLLAVVMVVNCGPVYAFVPFGVFFGFIAVMAALVALVKGMDNI